MSSLIFTEGKAVFCLLFCPPATAYVSLCVLQEKNAGFNVQRLKEKIGDRSNASSEVEYRNAWGVMIGEPGRGVRTIVTR